jgi:signal transduction histidine kinase
VPHRGKDALVKLDRRGNGLLEEVYIDFVFVPLHTPEGRVDSVFVHAYDVTDKVSAVRHAEQLRLDAVRAVRTREDLLAIVSHDLRNPLSTVLMGATHIERIADDSDAGLRTKKAASSIVRAADRMSRLIGDLLDLAKLEAGQPLPLELATHDMVELTQQAAELHEPLARSRQLTLRTDLAGPLYVLCDSDRVQQVLANLIGNAIKFTREGGLIEIAAKVTDGETVVSVRDTGTGIPDHQIPHIFEPYWQADAQRKGSAGLGLSIAKAIVDAHGGRIWVETSPGLGSTFSFTVSAAEAPHTPGLVGAGHG